MSEKIKFYSVHRAYTETGTELREHTGYTDGRFNFYGNAVPGTWFAIDPETGLAVATGESAREVREKVKTEAFRQKFERAKKGKRYSALKRQFSDLKSKERTKRK